MAMAREVFFLSLPHDLKEWLREYAERHGLSMTTVVQILLEREQYREKGSHDGKPLFAFTGVE
jgi:hypothetical protein